MKNLVLSISKENKSFDIVKDETILIFENVTAYEEEIISMIEENKISYLELESLVKSWGGKLKSVKLKMIINEYYKSIEK
jgi:glutamine phosphoribosylpyrophosphate amidotransferase